MAETLSTIGIISFVAAGACLILAIVLFIHFKIPSILGDLSGKNAQKSIEQIRKRNEESGRKLYKPSKTNVRRGMLTETMPLSKEKSSSNSRTSYSPDNTETEVLQDTEETAPLYEGPQNVLQKDNDRIPVRLLDETILIHTDEKIR